MIQDQKEMKMGKYDLNCRFSITVPSVSKREKKIHKWEPQVK